MSTGNLNDTMSAGRQAPKLTGKAETKKGKKLQILRARQAFLFLPVYCSSDIVHGSWWFVWGSLLSVPIAIVTLVDVYIPFFSVPDNTALRAFGQSVTWILLIISGILYTFGSLAYVRALHEPPPPPIFNDWLHFQTDELLGAWIFLLAAIPSFPFSLVYINNDPHVMTYWGLLFASFLLIGGSIFLVYLSYPSKKRQFESSRPHILPIVEYVFGKTSFVCKHVETDWLASAWLIFCLSCLFLFGTFLGLITATNDRQIFVWLTGFFDMLCFTLGSAYIIAGSYPRIDNYFANYDKEAEQLNWDEVNNPLYDESIGVALSLSRQQDVESKGSSKGPGYRPVNRENKSVRSSNSPSDQEPVLESKLTTTRPGRTPADLAKEKEGEVYNILHKYSKLSQPDGEMPSKTAEGKASPGTVADL